MRLQYLKNAEMRARYLTRLRKKIWHNSGKHNKTIPLFVAGWQRSGTTMLMNVFHLHPDVEVYNEAYKSKVFSKYRVKNMKILEKSMQQSRFPFACYKIICDSHIIKDFIEKFPDSKIIWMYRNAPDNAESQLRQFPHATRAVRLVAKSLPGGGWFADGVSQEVAKILREVTLRELTEFDYACLAWWVRNSLYFDLGLEHITSVRLLQYEELVQNPREVIEKLFYWLGVEWNERAIRFVHARSVGKSGLPNLDPKVEELCNKLKKRLDYEFLKTWPTTSHLESVS